MLQVGAEHDYAVLLYSRRNTCNGEKQPSVKPGADRVSVIIFYKNAILRSSNANNSHSSAVISVSFSKNLFASQKLILGTKWGNIILLI
jgi:hypothetical protein